MNPDSFRKRLPDVIIIGVKKAGTMTLGSEYIHLI